MVPTPASDSSATQAGHEPRQANDEPSAFDLSAWDVCFDHRANPSARVSSLQEWIDRCG